MKRESVCVRRKGIIAKWPDVYGSVACSLFSFVLLNAGLF